MRLQPQIIEGDRCGTGYLTVDASLMSRPILERLGFRWLSDTYPCAWYLEERSSYSYPAMGEDLLSKLSER